jgi:hypothetical protein
VDRRDQGQRTVALSAFLWALGLSAHTTAVLLARLEVALSAMTVPWRRPPAALGGRGEADGELWRVERELGEEWRGLIAQVRGLLGIGLQVGV